MSAHANRHGHQVGCDYCKMALRKLKTLVAIYPKFNQKLNKELSRKVASVS